MKVLKIERLQLRTSISQGLSRRIEYLFSKNVYIELLMICQEVDTCKNEKHARTIARKKNVQ